MAQLLALSRQPAVLRAVISAVGVQHATTSAEPWVLLVTFASLVVVSRTNREPAAYALVLVGLPLLAQMFFYTIDGWRDFRVLAPFHALAGLSFFARASLGFDNIVWRRCAVAAGAVLVVLNLSWLALGIREHYEKNWKHRVISVNFSGRVLVEALAPNLTVSADDTRACQTLYTPADTFNGPRLIHLPNGVGVSALQLDDSGAPPSLKGKYALIAERYANTRASLRALNINPDNHESIIGAELTGRIRQGRSSGWADDDPRNPKPDVNQLFAASSAWRLVSKRDEYSLYRSTGNCRSASRQS